MRLTLPRACVRHRHCDRGGDRRRRRRRRCRGSRSSRRRRRPASRRRVSRRTSRRRRRTTTAIRRAPMPRSGSDAGSRISDASATRSTSTRAASRGTRTSARLYRHRGHRYITIRKFDLGDRRSAARVAARRRQAGRESNPTARRTRPAFRAARCSRTSGITSASRSICAAISARRSASYREGMKVSRVNDDMLVATERLALHDAAPPEARRRGAARYSSRSASRWTSSRTAPITRGC